MGNRIDLGVSYITLYLHGLDVRRQSLDSNPTDKLFTNYFFTSINLNT